MEVTTTAETTGVMKRRQYFANRPSTPSATPPAIMAPIAAPYPYCAAMVQSTVTNVKLTPMTMGKRDPTRHTGNSWMNVPMPAMTIAAWMTMDVCDASSPAAAATIAIGAKFATNMASTCWMPYGNAFPKEIFPSNDRSSRSSSSIAAADVFFAMFSARSLLARHTARSCLAPLRATQRHNPLQQKGAHGHMPQGALLSLLIERRFRPSPGSWTPQ